MKKKYVVVQVIISILSGCVGGFMGAVTGIIGMVLGIVSGLIVGYYYVYFTWRLKGKTILLRLFGGIIYGTIAGIISGACVHIPGLFIEQPSDSLIGIGMSTGALFGAIIGTVLGFIGAVIIIIVSAIGRKDE